jgi:hypothetical protein
MQPQPLSQTECFAYVVADIADAISVRPGETRDQRFIRSQVATHLILGLAPRGAIELVLAGHTVMFHTLMTDSIRITLQGEIDTMRRSTRAGVIAMNHAFHRNLDKLEQYRSHRSDDGQAEAPEAQTPAPEPVQTKATPDTANQKPAPVSPNSTPAVEAPIRTLVQPFAPRIPAGCPLPPEPIAADRVGETVLGAEPSAPTIAPIAASAAASANENDAVLEASRPRPPQLNRAQKRLLRHGQHAR